MPKLVTLCRTRSPTMPSPSRSRYCGIVSKGNASTICWAVHSAVGCSVTLKWTILRRSCARTTKTNNTLNVAVGTTKKSIATRSFKCRSRNVRQVAEGNLSLCGLYLSTVDFATSIPNLRSLATMRGEPHVGLDRHIRLMSCRNSGAIFGRPGRRH